MKTLRFCALMSIVSLLIAATPRPLPHHPGNIFVEGEDVLLDSPLGPGPWRLSDYDDKEVRGTGSGLDAGAINLGKLRVGYYEVRRGNGPRVTLAVIAPLKVPTPP